MQGVGIPVGIPALGRDRLVSIEGRLDGEDSRGPSEQMDATDTPVRGPFRSHGQLITRQKERCPSRSDPTVLAFRALSRGSGSALG